MFATKNKIYYKSKITKKGEVAQLVRAQDS